MGNFDYDLNNFKLIKRVKRFFFFKLDIMFISKYGNLKIKNKDKEIFYLI